MIFKYGSYAHAQNEVALTIEKKALVDSTGQRTALRSTWKLNGLLHASDPASLTTAINQLQAAYNVDGQSAGLYFDDGTTPTSHLLENDTTLAGIRVSSIRFPSSDGAEYTTYRSYEITLEADFADDLPLLTQFYETIQFTGGGPRFVYLQTLSGLPQKQLVAESTPYFVTQSGSTAASSGYPDIPGPLWPVAEHVDERVVTYTGPQAADGWQQLYRVEWKYRFESAVALSGLPSTL